MLILPQKFKKSLLEPVQSILNSIKLDTLKWDFANSIETEVEKALRLPNDADKESRLKNLKDSIWSLDAILRDIKQDSFKNLIK